MDLARRAQSVVADVPRGLLSRAAALLLPKTQIQLRDRGRARAAGPHRALGPGHRRGRKSAH